MVTFYYHLFDWAFILKGAENRHKIVNLVKTIKAAANWPKCLMPEFYED